MKATISHATGLYSLEKAKKIANELNSSPDDDWSYKVTETANGKYGRIDVYDEEGELVEKGFLI